MASVPRARPASPRGRSYSVLWATGADSLDSHRPTSAPLGWSACGLRWSICRTIGHGGSNILGRSSSPSLPGKLCVGYHWMKRMGLARSLVQQMSFKAGCCGLAAASPLPAQEHIHNRPSPDEGEPDQDYIERGGVVHGGGDFTYSALT